MQHLRSKKCMFRRKLFDFLDVAGLMNDISVVIPASFLHHSQTAAGAENQPASPRIIPASLSHHSCFIRIIRFVAHCCCDLQVSMSFASFPRISIATFPASLSHHSLFVICIRVSAPEPSASFADPKRRNKVPACSCWSPHQVTNTPSAPYPAL